MVGPPRPGCTGLPRHGTVVATRERSKFTYTHIRIAQPSVRRVSAVRDLYSCALLSR